MGCHHHQIWRAVWPTGCGKTPSRMGLPRRAKDCAHSGRRRSGAACWLPGLDPRAMGHSTPSPMCRESISSLCTIGDICSSIESQACPGQWPSRLTQTLGNIIQQSMFKGRHVGGWHESLWNSFAHTSNWHHAEIATSRNSRCMTRCGIRQKATVASQSAARRRKSRLPHLPANIAGLVDAANGRGQVQVQEGRRAS